MRTSTLRSRTGRGASAAVALLTSAALLTGCVIGDVDQDGGDGGDGGDSAISTESAGGTPQPTTSGAEEDPDSTGSTGDLEVPADLGEVSVAVLDDGKLLTGGSLADGGDFTDAAWSTSKVPLSIAALRHAGDGGDEAAVEQVSGNVRQAITASDNAAADALWDSLGDPATAASQVEDVLAEAGDGAGVTSVPSERPRIEFSAYGQTQWSLGDQARFAARLGCLDSAGPVVEAMGQVDPGQSYGIGRFDDALFKGGWGPGNDGRYLVRQFGLVPGADGTVVPVAVAAVAPDGSYEAAQGVLDDLVEALRDRISGATGVTPPGEQGDC